jgi:signal transduction histidine kinase
VRRLTRLATAVQDSGDLRRRVPVPPAHDEIRDLAETLNAMLGRLEAAFAVQRRFVADASHDLRTPVAAILSLAENARDGVGVRTSTHALAAIAEQAQRLRQLITTLLQLSRADEGRLESEREPLQVAALLQDVVAGMQPLAEERGITLHLGALEEGVVLGDLAQLLLVLMNLVDNALTYTPRGGQVRLSSHRAGARIAIAVQDTGMGIASADLPHIFERFYRADPARRRATGGSGLGLTIVRTLVEAHQGTATVDSAPGVGSRFLIWLPLAG